MTQPAETTTPPSATTQNTETPAQSTTTTAEQQIPKARFDEVNTRAKAAEAELERIKTEREEADRKAAEKNGEWQKLAEQHTAELSSVKPKLKAAEETVERLTTALEKHVKLLRKDVPEHISGLLDRLDPVDQLDWITKNQEQLGPGGVMRGNGPNPRPAGQQGSHETRVQENQRKLQSTGAYNPF